MSLSKRYKSEEEIEKFFNDNSKCKSVAFEKALSNCIHKDITLSLFNLLLEYEQIIEKTNAKKFNQRESKL